MGVTIHPTAIIGENTVFGDGCIIGPYAIIEPGAVLDQDNELGAGCYLYGSVRLGKGNRLMHGATLGGEPQSLGYRGEPTQLIIGDRNWIGEYVTVHRGTADTGETVIGNGNFLMAYSHVGHDCRLGDHTIVANSVNLAGHVQVMDRANIGGGAAIHQFARVGELAMVGGLSRVSQDVMPFAVLARDNTLYGLNRIGIQRSAYATAALPALKAAYRRFCLGREPLDAFLNWLQEQPANPFLAVWYRFLSSGSRRGYARGERTKERKESRDIR